MRKKNEEVAEKIVRSIPASENGSGVLCITKSGQKYRISLNTEKMKFTLWKIVENRFIKVKTDNSLFELNDMIPWEQ